MDDFTGSRLTFSIVRAGLFFAVIIVKVSDCIVFAQHLHFACVQGATTSCPVPSLLLAPAPLPLPLHDLQVGAVVVEGSPRAVHLV